MNTITAKELRDNLGEIAKRVSAGERVRVSYRNKELFELRPLTNDKPKPAGTMPGLDALLIALKDVKISDKYKKGNLKEIYREEMSKKYGIY